MINSRKELIKVTEAAQLLSCSADTIRKWTDEGKLKHIRTPSGHRLIFMTAIREILEGSK